MKRIWNLFGTVVLAAAVLCGCTAQPSTTETPSAPADPLTGAELRNPGERVAAVVIQNNSDIAAQWGIGSAALVLEAQTEENTSTELCLVYSSLNQMPTVGPVTTGQDLYWRLLSGQQVLPIQLGSSRYTENYLEQQKLGAVDALEVGRNAFFSDEVWNSALLWRTSGSAVRQCLPSLGLSSAVTSPQTTDPSSGTEVTTALPAFFPHAESGQSDPDSQDAHAVWIDFASESATGFVYNETLGCYEMSNTLGSAQIDANTGKQAGFDNVLVLYSSSSLRDDGKTLDYDLSMGGGIWLNGGRLWQITWTQGVDTTLAFYDSDGEELNILPGRSYLALLSSVTGQELSVYDSAGEDLLALMN